MKRILGTFYYFFLRFALSLRYRIRVRGMEALSREALNKPGGILFLANHPAEIDPCILLRAFWPKFHLHPVAIDYLFRRPIVRYLLDFVGALAIPNFDGSSNSFKKRQIEKTYEEIYRLLRNKENLLIYPAGGLKPNAEEVLGGASGVQTILQNAPDVNVVLVRTTGLWGSSFSKAPTGKTPDLYYAFTNGLKVILRNFIFFAPRREVIIDCTPAPADFPWKGERREINSFLENWYNLNGPEPLKLVSFSRWREVVPQIQERAKEEEVALNAVPEETREVVIEEIAKLTKVSPILPDHHLAMDLGLDSLDFAQIIVMLKENFGVNGLHSSDLTTVGSVIAFAAQIRKGKEEEEETVDNHAWNEKKGRPSVQYAEGKTLQEIFLHNCDRMKGYLACADHISGEVSYRKLKFGVLLLAEAIRKLPGERIGILMPASVVVNAVILATLMAGKVPVMINWTLGKRNLSYVVEQSGIQTTLSSWSFLDRLDNVELDGLDDQIVLLEELRRNFSLWDSFKAFRYSQKKASSLMKKFGLDQQSGDETAVILFTSGTESVPKGVPLSHRNLIANQSGAYALTDIGDSDVLLGVLPPFHSFGFSVTGILPLLAGLRVAYSPNPTDGRRMANAIEKWSVTVLCMAPSFLKNLLRVASDRHLKLLRLVVSGAEKTPPDIFEKMNAFNSSACVVEGYGITECSPILTLNPPGKPSKGVGLPLPGVELKVVGPETLTPLSLGEQGLILARGPNVFSGYLDPNLPTPFVQVEGNLWYQTGDLGFIDEQGYLTLSGRFKRFIKIGGEMVSLTAVEETLIQAASQQGWEVNPDVPSLAVCAREEEGKKSEMHLFAIFETSAEEINKILREYGMSNLVRIRSVQKVPFIPLLGTGKIDYRKLTGKL